MIALETESLIARQRGHYRPAYDPFFRNPRNEQEQQTRRARNQQRYQDARQFVTDSGGTEGIVNSVQNIANLFSRSQEQGPDMPSDYAVNLGATAPNPDQQLQTWHYIVLAGVGVGCIVALVHYLKKKPSPVDLEVRP